MDLHVTHRSDIPDAYALTTESARLVLRIGVCQGVESVVVHYGDRYSVSLTDEMAMQWSGTDGKDDYYTATITVPTHRLHYIFYIVTQRGDVWFGESGLTPSMDEKTPKFHLPYLCKRDMYEVPDWVNHAVCYQIFPERFENGNPALTPKKAVPWHTTPTATSMHGGDLAGITKRLGYLEQLGVNLLYLTPIFQAGSNHKYDTTNYMKIDPQFGTEADLRILVREAHNRGIRVLLDAVFNHAGLQFSPFQDVAAKGQASAYWDWFFIEGDEVDLDEVNYETFATKLKYMPKLNVANKQVERYLIDVATYWVRSCDIDGWRLDVANEIDHVFWRRFREAVKSVKPDALIIGEVWHDSLPWLRGDQFDGVMNYLAREAVLNCFIYNRISFKTFAEQMTHLQYLYPEQAIRSMLNLIGSHDTARILTLSDGDIAKVVLAMVCQFTIPGIPMVYYGDEIGMEGEMDPDCRRGMVWNTRKQNRKLQAIVRTLVKLRTTRPALQGTGIQFVQVTDNTLVYERIGPHGDRVQVAFAFGPAAKYQIKKKRREILFEYTGSTRDNPVHVLISQ